jgi:hypothetical protein
VQPDGAARRLLRDAYIAHSEDLQELLSARCEVAVQRYKAGEKPTRLEKAC